MQLTDQELDGVIGGLDKEVEVVPMIASDLDAVYAIEVSAWQYPLSRQVLDKQFHTRSVRKSVARINGNIVGYVFFAVHETHVELIAVAVSRFYRRRGIGSKLVNAVLRETFRKPNIECDVRERNLTAQLFLKANAFQCIRQLRDAYVDGEDCYIFKYMPAEYFGGPDCDGV